MSCFLRIGTKASLSRETLENHIHTLILHHNACSRNGNVLMPTGKWPARWRNLLLKQPCTHLLGGFAVLSVLLHTLTIICRLRNFPRVKTSCMLCGLLLGVSNYDYIRKKRRIYAVRKITPYGQGVMYHKRNLCIFNRNLCVCNCM